MVQADDQFRSRVGDIQRLEVRTAEGRMVPLSTLVSVQRNRRAVGNQPVQHVPLGDDYRSAGARIQRG